MMRDGAQVYVFVAGEGWQRQLIPDDAMTGVLRCPATGDSVKPWGGSWHGSDNRNWALLEFEAPAYGSADEWTFELLEAGQVLLRASGPLPRDSGLRSDVRIEGGDDGMRGD